MSIRTPSGNVCLQEPTYLSESLSKPSCKGEGGQRIKDVSSWERRGERINPTTSFVSKHQITSRLPSFKPLVPLLPASPTYLSALRTFPTLPAKLKWKRSQSRNDWGGFSLIKLEQPNVPFKGNCLPCSCMQTTTSNVCVCVGGGWNSNRIVSFQCLAEQAVETGDKGVTAAQKSIPRELPEMCWLHKLRTKYRNFQYRISYFREARMWGGGNSPLKTARRQQIPWVIYPGDQSLNEKCWKTGWDITEKERPSFFTSRLHQKLSTVSKPEDAASCS